MDFYHTHFIEAFDVDLADALIAMTFVIIIAIIRNRLSTRSRERHLRKLMHSLDKLALPDGKFVLKQCVSLMKKASPFELFRISQDNDSLLKTNFSVQFKECLTQAGKIDYAEKTARTARNKWQRIEALIITASLQTPHMMEIIDEALISPDDDIVYFAMLALGQIKTEESAKRLIMIIKQRRISGQKVSAVLEKFDPGIVPFLFSYLEDTDTELRFWILKSASRLNPKGFAERLIPLTQSPEDDIRAAACECLGETAETSASAALSQLVHDPAWFVRLHAIRSLEKISGASCLNQVFNIFDDDNWTVRNEAKNIAAKHIRESVPFIENFLKHGTKSQKHLCLEMLDISGETQRIVHNLAKDSHPDKAQEKKLLQLMIRADAYLGVAAACRHLTGQDRSHILDIIKTVDAGKAQKIEKILKK